jgi:hypothetical protein
MVWGACYLYIKRNVEKYGSYVELNTQFHTFLLSVCLNVNDTEQDPGR